ncbi:MAG TPA: hypothetical protein VEX69_01745, partial [Candidatus Limnocylindria bacterium]|nr:hypothetical protein [Candidatus Limnocylindria bacterium]
TNPSADYSFKHFLEWFQAIGGSACIEKSLIRVMNASICLYKLWQGVLEHRLSLVLIKLRQNEWLGKLEAGILIRLGDDSGRIQLAYTRARTCAIKEDFAPRPIFPQMLCLRLA